MGIRQDLVRRAGGKFAAAMADARDRLKVGIRWSGSTTARRGGAARRGRGSPGRWFAPPGVQLDSLQKGPPEAELTSLPKGAPIVDLSPLIADFADAAAVAELDLMLMTDSAMAHLTGAIGRSVWVLLNRVPHWLWLLEREDSPWYPSMRAWGDWNRVFDEAAAAPPQLSQARR